MGEFVVGIDPFNLRSKSSNFLSLMEPVFDVLVLVVGRDDIARPFLLGVFRGSTLDIEKKKRVCVLFESRFFLCVIGYLRVCE